MPCFRLMVIANLKRCNKRNCEMLRENEFSFPKMTLMSSENSDIFLLALFEIWFVFTFCVAEKDMRTSLINSVNIIFLCSYFLLGLGTFLRKSSTRLGSTIPISKWFPISWILMNMYVWNNTFLSNMTLCGI